jgi:hypothetical protein
MANKGAKATPSTPAAFGQHVSAGLARWNALVERIGLKVQ